MQLLSLTFISILYTVDAIKFALPFLRFPSYLRQAIYQGPASRHRRPIYLGSGFRPMVWRIEYCLAVLGSESRLVGERRLCYPIHYAKRDTT